MTNQDTKDPEIIDFSNEILAIKKQFGLQYWSKPEAMKALANLWGASGNNAGILDYKVEIII